MKKCFIPVAFTGSALLALATAGCPTIKTENEVTIKPIQVDLNVNVKVDQALADALSDKKQAAQDKAKDPERAARRERFMARRPKLEEWRKLGAVGENNRGLAEMIQAPDDAKLKAEMTELLAAENKDRDTVLHNIAKRENATIEFITQRWTAKMAQRVPAGTMIQSADGKWSKKQ